MNPNTDKQKKKHPLAKFLLVILLLFLLLSLVMYGLVNSKLNLIQYDDGEREIDTETEYEINNEEIAPNDLPNTSVDVDDGEGLHVIKDPDVFNILLLGTDERTNKFNDNARADSMMVCSLNTKLHTIKLVSIERGIGVPVPGRNDDWLTHTFRYGGAKLTMDTISEQFYLDLDHYVRVNFRIFEEGIDALGGVDVELDAAEVEYLGEVQRAQGDWAIEPIHVGMNHLNGKWARALCQLREIDSDWRRIERQRRVIQAALNQAKTLSLSQLNDVLNHMLPLVQTNLTKFEIADLMLEVPGFIAEGLQIEDMTIPTRETCWNSVGVDGRKMIAVDFEANARILQELFYGVKPEEDAAA